MSLTTYSLVIAAIEHVISRSYVIVTIICSICSHRKSKAAKAKAAMAKAQAAKARAKAKAFAKVRFAPTQAGRKVSVPEPLKDGVNLKQCRISLKQLDVTIAHSVKHNGKWKSVPLQDAVEMYKRRRRHMQGWNATLDWHMAHGLKKDC